MVEGPCRLSSSVRSARRDGISASVLSSELKPAASSAHMVEKICWLASTLTPLTAESALAWPCRLANGTLKRKIATTKQARNESDRESFRMTKLPWRFQVFRRYARRKQNQILPGPARATAHTEHKDAARL